MRKKVLDAGGAKGKAMKWSDVIEDFERTEYCQSRSCGVIKKLENEGVVKVAGERDKRMIRLIEG